MNGADFLVVGGGIAGLSAAAALSRHGRVVVLEAEDAPGYHASGRSATIWHYGIGDRTVRALTSYSRRFFEQPPEGFSEGSLTRPTKALFIAREEMVEALERLYAGMALFTDDIAWTDEDGMTAVCPVLRTGPGAVVRAFLDTGPFRLDSSALLAGYARAVRATGGRVVTRQRAVSIEREGSEWVVGTESGERWAAPILVNAAGAWADAVANLAGATPLGLEPKRRTIIQFDPPAGTDVRGWPFVRTPINEFYMLPEGGRLIASPSDETPDQPCDAQPDDYDIALAAYRVEEYTTLTVPRISSSWAGLRSFVSDLVPTAGFAPDAPGFFWLAGQGGYGLQTAPAMADAVEALVTGGSWPAGLAELGVRPEQILPDRLFSGSSQSLAT